VVVGWIESPRKRRRLYWLGGLVAAAAVAVGVILAIPSPKKENVSPTGAEGPAQTVAPTNVPLKASDRRAIDAVLAKFIPAAVGRRDAERAWALAGPELKTSSTLAEWKKGNSPVPYFPVRERTFTGWPTVDVERDQVTFSLLVHPKKGSNLGDYTFSVEAIRARSSWLINRIYTIAINNPVRNGKHEIGPADFGAPSAGSSSSSTKPRLSSSWLLPIVGILSLVFVVPVTLGIVLFVRSRRRRRKLAASGSTELPPLPSTFTSQQSGRDTARR
jgi:hypothetical protein